MQRDIGNELIVAIIAVGILAFALTFGIILSLSNQNTATPTNTAENIVLTEASEVASAPTDEPTVEVVASATETEEATLEVSASATETNEPTVEVAVVATETDELTLEPTATDEPTIEPSATATDEPTTTPTDEPLSTARPTTAPSKTPVEVVLAATEEPTVEPSVTATPTDEPTATATLAPSATATPTDEPTATDRPTATATNTLRPTNTMTATPTDTATRRPTATLTHTPTTKPSSTPVPTIEVSICVAPFGWSAHVVQPNENLSGIAARAGSTLAEVRAGNECLTSNLVSVGDIVFVPEQAGGSPEVTPDADLSVLGCTDEGVQITSPLPGQQVGTVFVLNGTASTDSFLYFKVELRSDFATLYELHALTDRMVQDGPLAQINTDNFSSGLYWIRLSVVDLNDRVSATPCVLPVYFP